MIRTVTRERKENAQNQTSFYDLFRYRRLRWTTINLCIQWMVNSGIYYGISLIVSDLGGNPYYSYLISALVEIPAFLRVLLTLERPFHGRRRSHAGFSILSGSLLALTVFVPNALPGLLLGLTVLVKIYPTTA